MVRWPRHDAPLSEWLRPVSARLPNQRAPEREDEGRFGALGQVVKNMRREAKRKRRENGA